MDESMWILYFPRERKDFFDQDMLQSLYSTISGQQFYLIADDENGAYQAWMAVFFGSQKNDVTLEIKNTFSSAGVSLALQQALKDYLVSQQKTLSFHACSIESTGILNGFEFGVSIDPEEGYILLSVEAERFFGDPAGEEGFELKTYWIELIKKVFMCCHPLYAYEFDHSASVLQPKKEDVRSLNIKAVYGVNFFGPEFVTKLGRERLLTAPTRRIETLSSNEIFLYCPRQEQRRAVAKHLNLIAANVDEEVDDE